MIAEVLKIQFGYDKKFRLIAIAVLRSSFTLALFNYVKTTGCMGWSLFHIIIGHPAGFDFYRKGVVVHVGYKRFIHYWNDEETQPLFQDLLQQCIIFPTDIKYEV